MTYLVAGRQRVDAGKTTFAVGLTQYLQTTAYKPRAGNDYWFDHTDYQSATNEGRLYGKDAYRLATASHTDVTPEEINPVHRLWRPAPERDGFIGPPDRAFLVDRIGNHYVINDNATLPDSAWKRLPLEDPTRISTIEELNQVTHAEYLPRFEALADRINQTPEAVVESYGDIARPIRGIDVSRVAVVEPERARVYDGDRYAKACDVVTGGPETGQLEERVDEIVDLIDPEATIKLPALSGKDRESPERIAEAYRDAYTAVCE